MDCEEGEFVLAKAVGQCRVLEKVAGGHSGTGRGILHGGKQSRRQVWPRMQ